MRAVKFIATVSEYGNLETRAAVKKIDKQLITTALAYFGGLEIVDILDHPQPTEPNTEDIGFTVRLQTADSNHYAFSYDDQILVTYYPEYPDQVSVTQQAYFGIRTSAYTTGKPNLGFIASQSFNFAGNYSWGDYGYDRSLMVYLDDDDNIIGMSDIRMENYISNESVLLIDYAKSKIYMTDGFMSKTGVINANSWLANINSDTPVGVFRYYGLKGTGDKAFQTPVIVKDPFNNFAKYEGTIELVCFGMDSIYDYENYGERIEVGEQKYIHIGNHNMFFPYDTYEEIELEND